MDHIDFMTCKQTLVAETYETHLVLDMVFFFSSRRRHTRLQGDWSSDVCSSDLIASPFPFRPHGAQEQPYQRIEPVNCSCYAPDELRQCIQTFDVCQLMAEHRLAPSLRPFPRLRRQDDLWVEDANCDGDVQLRAGEHSDFAAN